MSESATVCGTEDDDVWFSFVATATTHRFSMIELVEVLQTCTIHYGWWMWFIALWLILCDVTVSTRTGGSIV